MVFSDSLTTHPTVVVVAAVAVVRRREGREEAVTATAAGKETCMFTKQMTRKTQKLSNY